MLRSLVGSEDVYKRQLQNNGGRLSHYEIKRNTAYPLVHSSEADGSPNDHPSGSLEIPSPLGKPIVRPAVGTEQPVAAVELLGPPGTGRYLRPLQAHTAAGLPFFGCTDLNCTAANPVGFREDPPPEEPYPGAAATTGKTASRLQF